MVEVLSEYPFGSNEEPTLAKNPAKENGFSVTTGIDNLEKPTPDYELDEDYYDESYWDYAVVINWLGFGGRHHDFNIYSNLELDCGCISLGCRYTYYF